jgi:hypothetical protein
MTLKSSRVELRSPTPADCDEFLAAMGASRKLDRPWLQSPTTPEAYDRLLSRAELDRYEPLLICRCDDRAIVARIRLS